MLVNDNSSVFPRYASPFITTRIKQRLIQGRDRAVYRMAGYFLTHPKIPRRVFAALRRIRPIFVLGRLAIVTRHDDVQSVLRRSRDFELGEFARERMVAGQFILDVDWPRSHIVQENALRSAGQSCASEQISRIAQDACQEVLATAQKEVDVAALARHAALSVVQGCYGVTPRTASGEDMAPHLTALASAIILLPPFGTKERAELEAAAATLGTHVRALIEARKGALAKAPEDMMTGLLKQSQKRNAPSWLTEDWVARTICGMSIFGMATIVRTASDVIDEMLNQHRPVLRNAVTAVTKNDREALKGVIYEALRFRPMLPVLARYCPRQTTIGAVAERRRILPAGATVWAPPLAAMHDPVAYPDPETFNAGHAPEKSLVFGGGLHKCLGRHVAEAALIEIVGAILRHGTPRRQPGPQGKIRYRGAAVQRFAIGF